MTDITEDIAAIRGALPWRRIDESSVQYLPHDAAAWQAAANPERIDRLLDALERERAYSKHCEELIAAFKAQP